MGGKEGVAGEIPIDGISLTNSNGDIIHTFSNEDAIKQYAKSVSTSQGNFADAMGNLSTTSGIIADVSDLPIISVISIGSGLIKAGSDIKKTIDLPTVDNVTNVVIDAVGFIPNGGAIASYGLAETKKATEMTIEIEKEYQKKEIINKFTPSEQRQIDYGHEFVRTIKQCLSNLFGGK